MRVRSASFALAIAFSGAACIQPLHIFLLVSIFSPLSPFPLRPSSFPTNTPHVFACHNIWLKAQAILSISRPRCSTASGGREAVTLDGCEAVCTFQPRGWQCSSSPRVLDCQPLAPATNIERSTSSASLSSPNITAVAVASGNA